MKGGIMPSDERRCATSRAVNPPCKSCTKCGAEKPLSEFYNCCAGRYGKSSWCKECMVRRKETPEYREVHNRWQRQEKVRAVIRESVPVRLL